MSKYCHSHLETGHDIKAASLTKGGRSEHLNAPEWRRSKEKRLALRLHVQSTRDNACQIRSIHISNECRSFLVRVCIGGNFECGGMPCTTSRVSWEAREPQAASRARQ